jgi:3-deoxy-manno-octulosonate cytidylyltransferase (CMP-KDO synthetase)
MDTIGIIPARYGSTRFEGKALADIHGKPMVQHVYERAVRSRSVGGVIVATDDERIFQAVKRFGGEVVMTGPHYTGLERVAEAACQFNVQFVLNIQGDEPMLDPVMLDEIVELLRRHSNAGMATLMARIYHEEDFDNPNVVKVVADARGMALYFSRSLIPYPRFRTPDFCVYDHIGIYGYRKEALLKFAALGPSKLEQIESLEQLRALENGIPIAVAETRCSGERVSVDTIEDLERARALLAPQYVEV